MSKALTGAFFWATYFLIAELPAHFISWWPYPTLSRTVWDGIKWWHPIAFMVAIFLFALWGHLDRNWSAGWLILVGVLIAAAITAHAVTT